MKSISIILSVTILLAVGTGFLLSDVGRQTEFGAVVYEKAADLNLPLIPSRTPTNTPTSTPTNTPTNTPTSTPTNTPTNTPTSTPTSTPTNTPTNTPTFTPTPRPTNPPVSSGPSYCNAQRQTSFENQIINLINKERTSRGLSQLSYNGLLVSAALGHSRDMACNNFFSHTSPRTGDVSDRVRAAGYSASLYGENIAAGYTSASSVVAGWMSSPGHRSIILNPSFVHIGVGHAYVEGNKYQNLFTAVFAKP